MANTKKEKGSSGSTLDQLPGNTPMPRAGVERRTVAAPKVGLAKADMLRERGKQLLDAADALQETMLAIGVIGDNAFTHGSDVAKEKSIYTTMDGLCALQASAQTVNNALYIFVNGPDMGEDDDGCNDATESAREQVAHKTEFGRRVAAKSEDICGLFSLVNGNLTRIEQSLLHNEPKAVAGSQGPSGPSGPRGIENDGGLSVIALIDQLESRAHDLEMRIVSINSNLRETY